jgi:hypothetical protein
MISRAPAANISRVPNQPMPLIRPDATGIIRNWPKEPAAATTPIAQPRLASGTRLPRAANTTL